MITSVSLENFKRFSHVQVNMAPLSVFMGLNGVGKSSTIQALLLLRQSAISGGLSQGRLDLSGDLCTLGSGQDVFHEGAGADEAISIEIAGSLPGPFVSRFEFAYVPDLDTLRMSGAAPTVLGPLAAERFTYLTADRMGPRLSSPRAIERARRGDLGIRGEGSLAVLEQSRSTTLSVGDPRIGSGADASVTAQVQLYLAGISPGARLEITSYDSLDSISAGFSFSNQGPLATRSFRPTNVGFGLSYSLPIIVACLTALPGSMLIIENPEAHLHTVGQRRMAELLVRTAQAGVQVVVETHSREIFYHLRKLALQNEYDGKLATLSYFWNSGDSASAGVSLATLPEIDGSLADLPQEFFDSFGSPTDLVLPPREDRSGAEKATVGEPWSAGH